MDARTPQEQDQAAAKEGNRATVVTPGGAKGRAMLVWEGKQAPAPEPIPRVQLVEIVDPRMELPLAQSGARPADQPTPRSFLRQAVPNCLFHGENRAILAHLLGNGWRGQFRLIYIDPPFDSGGEYVRKVRLRSGRIVGETTEYADSWPGDTYLQFIYERLFLLRDLLAEDGSIWLHCDYRQAHRLRLVLEEVFGEGNYLNTIAWRSQVARGAKVHAFYFPNSTQYIEIFAKNRSAPPMWNRQRRRLVFSRQEASAKFMEDEGGFFRTSDPGTYSFARLKELQAEGRLYAPYGGEVVVDEERERVYPSNGGNIGIKYYLTKVRGDRYAVERGVDNMWDDIPGLGTTPSEDTGYPTQKTEALLRRVVSAATKPGDWILDCFAGSGTVAAVAQKMRRRWIVCDSSYGAVQTIRRRLQRMVQESGPGFAIYGLAGQEYLPPPALAPAVPVDISIEREAGRQDGVRVCLDHYRLSEENVQGGDWLAWIAAVDIDPAFNGDVFRALISDVPRKKGAYVSATYSVSAPERTTVAVRVTDVYGAEFLVTKIV